MSLKCIVFLYVIKYIIVNDCFVICVGSSLLSKTVDVTYPYYRIKTEICTYKACATIGCVRGKLVEMTIPRGTVGYRLYAAAANQEAGIKSCDTRHHCKQQWQTVNQIHQF